MLAGLLALGLTTVAFAQDDGTQLIAESEVVYLDPVGIGSSIPFTVQFSSVGTVTVDSVSLENTKGQSFKFENGGVLDMGNGAGVLEMLYEPITLGQHSARIVISSDADCQLPQVVELRASAYKPCIIATPRVLDYGEMFPPDVDLEVVRLQSCDGGTYTVNSALTDNPRFTFGAQTPFQITPTGVSVTVEAQPIDTTPQNGTLTIGDWETTIELMVNDCYNGNPENYDSNNDGVSDCGIPMGGIWTDDDGDGWTEAEGDCDDIQASINPDATEVDGNIDDNCDGQQDEHLDADGDNVRVPDDCDDTNAWVSIGEVELFDGLDNDCDGQIDEGLSEATCGGEDGEGEGDSKGCGCDSTGSPLWLMGVGSLLLLRRRRSD